MPVSYILRRAPLKAENSFPISSPSEIAHRAASVCRASGGTVPTHKQEHTRLHMNREIKENTFYFFLRNREESSSPQDQIASLIWF